MKPREGFPDPCLSGGGEMGALMRARDWASTPLGPVERWPQSLRTLVGTMLASSIPMVLFWGREYIQLYNDGYIPVFGPNKHPQALGVSGRESWAEVWDYVGSRFDAVMDTAVTASNEDQLFLLDRQGFVEECYFTFSYSPVRDETGVVAGVLSTCVETTHRVIGARRLETLRALAALPARFSRWSEVVEGAAAALKDNAHDFSFSALYLREADDGYALVPAARAFAESGLLPETIRPGRDEGVLARLFLEVRETGRLAVTDAPEDAMGNRPVGVWNLPVQRIAVVPLTTAGQWHCAGFLVAGLSPRLAINEAYQSFIETAAASIVAALSHARAFEDEAQRARTLEDLDRLKTEFFSNISHEFRTPITLMMGPAELLLRDDAGALPEAARRQVDGIYRNSRRLLKLVNALLDFSRIGAGRAEASFQPTDLSQLTAELASMFRAAVERAGLRLDIDCPPLPAPVFVDRDMWEKIVLNLLSNALKFTFEGTIRVSLALSRDEVVLTVADSGVGIPAADLPRVFQRFHQVRGARSRTHEGSGIGLSLVHELARLHGGRAWARSAEGQGTAVSVAIPAGHAHLPAEQLHEAPVEAAVGQASAFVEEAMRWLPGEGRGAAGGVLDDLPSVPASPGLRRGRILVADDNADLREYLVQLLGSRYHVDVAADGRAALVAATACPPDLVLADVMMPGLDGLALLRALKADPRTIAVPVILLSARAGEESRIEGVAAGADDYLVKPFSARELLARIDARLELARLRRASDQREQALLAEITEGKSRVEAILASINDAFAVFDADWRYTYVNDATVRMGRRTREQLIGSVIWDCFPEMRGTIFESEMIRVARDRAPSRFEFCHQRSGRWFDVRLSAVAEGVSVLGTEITESKRAEATLRDVQTVLEAKVAARTGELAESNRALSEEVAERRRVERALRISEERFRKAFEDAAVGMAITDRAGRFLVVNRAYEWLTGRSRQELELRDLISLTDPEDRQATLKQLRRLLDGEAEFFMIEKRYLQDSGRAVWAQESVAIVRGDEGQPSNLIVLTEDISERKRVESALRASEVRFRALTELSSDWFWEQDEELRFTFISSGFQRTLGTDPAYLIGRTRWEQETLGLDDAQWKAHRELIANRLPFYGLEYGWRLSSGETRWFTVSGEPVFGEDGSFRGYRGASVEITGRHREQVRAEIIAELSLFALSENSLPVFLDRAVALVSDALEVELVKILQLQPDGLALKLVAGVGWDEGLVGHATVPADLASQAGYTLYANALRGQRRGGAREPVISDSLASETRFHGPELLHAHDVVSGVSVVIPGVDRAYGVFGMHSRVLRRFEKTDADFLTAVANVVSAAIVRHAASSALEQRERLLQDVLESMPVGVWIADRTGTIVQSNPAGRRIWAGERRVGIDGYGAYKGWWAGTDRLIQPTEWALARAIEQGETSLDELVDIECFDGTRRTILNSAVPLRDDRGSITGAIVVNEDVTARKLVEETVANVAAGMSAATGETFFQRLVERLSVTLGVDCAFVGEVVPGSGVQVRVLAAVGMGGNSAGFEYRLPDTPCANVVAEGLCVYPDKVAERFPKDRGLQEMGAQSYAGSPLRDSDGVVLGILAVISRRPLDNPQNAAAVLNIVGARAASELERSRNDETIRMLLSASEALHSAPDIATLGRRVVTEAVAVSGAQGGLAALRAGERGFASDGFLQGGAWQDSARTWGEEEAPVEALSGTLVYARSEVDGSAVTTLPLVSGERHLLGFIQLHDIPESGNLSRLVRERLLGLAQIASIALEKALSMDKALRAETGLRDSEMNLRALAARLQDMLEEERTRIAREIHDVLGQALTGVKLDIAWLKGLLSPGNEEAMSQIRGIGKTVDGIVQIVRRIASDLRPGELDDLGMVAAIESIAGEFQARSGIRCRVRLPERDLDIDPDAATALFRICQELLTNVIRHARASSVDVSLSEDEGTLVLVVKDNGRGINSREAGGRASLGLVGVRERARMFGGSVSIEGQPGEGTCVTVRLPARARHVPEPHRSFPGATEQR
jgi:PAS domain S-box-containing protein